MTRIVGLTGGIGSGKTTVSRVFEHLGVPVYRSDDEGRKLLADDQQVHDQIREVFGNEVFSEGRPDRQKLAGVVFGDKEQLNRLNAIIHPAVGRHFKAWIDKFPSAPYAIKESAILIENNLHLSSDHLILVTAPESVRIQRVITRDNTTAEAVRQRMAHQWSDEKKRPVSDFEIVNDDQRPVIPQVLEIHRVLTK